MISYRLVTYSGVRKYFFRESEELKKIPSTSCILERCMYDMSLTFPSISVHPEKSLIPVKQQ